MLLRLSYAPKLLCPSSYDVGLLSLFLLPMLLLLLLLLVLLSLFFWCCCFYYCCCCSWCYCLTRDVVASLVMLMLLLMLMLLMLLLLLCCFCWRLCFSFCCWCWYRFWYTCVAACCSFLPDIALFPFFQKVETAGKNEGSKRGKNSLANKCIENALVDMDLWIGEGNWKNSFGFFIDLRDLMGKYELRLAG